MNRIARSLIERWAEMKGHGGMCQQIPRDDWGNTRRMNGENGNGELVIFEFDESGEVVRLKMGDNYAYPVNK